MGYLFWKMSVSFGMEAMIPCEELEALVGAELGLMLATDSITEFSPSSESAIMNTLNISPCLYIARQASLSLYIY